MPKNNAGLSAGAGEKAANWSPGGKVSSRREQLL